MPVIVMPALLPVKPFLSWSYYIPQRVGGYMVDAP